MSTRVRGPLRPGLETQAPEDLSFAQISKRPMWRKGVHSTSDFNFDHRPLCRASSSFAQKATPAHSLDGTALSLPRPSGRPGASSVACSTCGVLRRRGGPLEKAAARVAENVQLQALNVPGISAHDHRQLEIIANGFTLWGGAQLAVDTTLISPVRRNGTPQPGADTEDGVQLQTARRRKELRYRELVQSRRCRLVVLALKVGGRWSDDAVSFVRLLAKAKARTVPQLLRSSARGAFFHRWSGILAVAAQRALAATLLELPVDCAGAVDGDLPALDDVLAGARLAEPQVPSRMA